MSKQLFLDPVQIERELCQRSFFDFVQRFWGEIIREEPVWNWHIEEICSYLQKAAERVFAGKPKLHDIVINVPPGTTKSTICSIMFPVWCWIRMASCRIISTSHAHSLAATLARQSRDVITSEKFLKLFPEIVLREDQNTKAHYENTDGGMRFAVGTDGGVIGRHAHVIVIDDPIDPQSAISDTKLNEANRFITETLSMRKIDKEVTLTILIMQRLHQNDPSAVLLNEAEEEGGAAIKHIKLPGIIDEGENPRDVVRPRRLAKRYINGLLDPIRLSKKALKAAAKRLGVYGYAGQIKQIPTPRGGGMFKVARIILDEPPALRHIPDLVRYWDKAGTKGGGAYTVGLLMGWDVKKRFWILDVVRGQWDSGAREAVIKQTAQIDSNQCGGMLRVRIGVEQEPGSSGKESAQNTVKMLAGFRAEADRPTGDKETRADAFSVQVNAENVYMKIALWNKEYLGELEFFPHSTYKDQVDASSGAFGLLTRPRPRGGSMRLSTE